MPKIAVIGEGVIDRFIDNGVHNDVIGGSGLNTAVALARAGSDVVWFTRISSDANGQVLKQYAKAQHVLSCDSIESSEPASLVNVFLAQDGQPKYEFALDGAVDWQWTTEELSGLRNSFNIIQVGSLSAVLEPGASRILSIIQSLKKSSVPPLITYDPNARPSAASNSDEAVLMKLRIQEFVALSDVVKVSDEDLKWIFPNLLPSDAAKDWSTRGPQLVVMTRGAAGALAFVDGEKVATVSGESVNVIDTVGAGDTFMAWLIHQLAHTYDCKIPNEKKAITSLLTVCAKAAAITCSRSGCQPPLASEVFN